MRYSFFGDKGILIEFGDDPTREISQKAFTFAKILEEEKISGVRETQPSYNTVLVYYDPLKIGGTKLMKRMKIFAAGEHRIEVPPPRVYDIPVLYGGEYGPDLEYVAEYHGITQEEVIGIHTKEQLWVYRIGLNVHNLVPVKLITPRRKVPRLRVPAGSIGIGNKQTGPYVIECAAGWNIIGRTPLKLYDPGRTPPFLIASGNYVHYRSIGVDEFSAIKSEVGFSVLNQVNYR